MPTCLFTRVCTHVHMYTHSCMHKHIYMHASIHPLMCKHTSTTNIQKRIHIHIHNYEHIRIKKYAYTHTCTCIYAMYNLAFSYDFLICFLRRFARPIRLVGRLVLRTRDKYLGIISRVVFIRGRPVPNLQHKGTHLVALPVLCDIWRRHSVACHTIIAKSRTLPLFTDIINFNAAWQNAPWVLLVFIPSYFVMLLGSTGL